MICYIPLPTTPRFPGSNPKPRQGSQGPKGLAATSLPPVHTQTAVLSHRGCMCAEPHVQSRCFLHAAWLSLPALHPHAPAHLGRPSLLHTHHCSGVKPRSASHQLRGASWQEEALISVLHSAHVAMGRRRERNERLMWATQSTVTDFRKDKKDM